jgi:hypothetical protein
LIINETSTDENTNGKPNKYYNYAPQKILHCPTSEAPRFLAVTRKWAELYKASLFTLLIATSPLKE